MEFENATRGDLALVVSQWGATGNPKVGPNKSIARAKSANDVERALPFFPSRVAVSNSHLVVGPGTRSPRCIK